MRDKKKFYTPKLEKLPKVGDIIIDLKYIKEAAVSLKNFNKIKKFFKIESFVGEGNSTKAGNIKVVNSELNTEGTFSPENYNSIKDNFEIIGVVGNKSNPSDGDIICHNSTLNIDATFSYNSWLTLGDDWDATGIYGVTTLEEDDTIGGEYVIMANGVTFIINSSDFSKISSLWEHVDTIYDYSQDYLTIVSLEDNNTISFKVTDSTASKTISVSTDNGNTWEQKTSTTSGVTLATLNTNDKLLIKGTSPSYNDTYGSKFNYFVSTSNFNVEGNIMSLIYGDNFINNNTLSSGYAFKGLFSGCNKLISGKNLILPATVLSNACYSNMFRGCSSLINTPKLPATTLASWCYEGMFQGCTSLTITPKLPAKTLATNCYYEMFKYCSSLKTVYELPAKTLVNYCYYSMFLECGLLNYIKCLATNISATECTYKWVENVASSGTFIKNPNMSSWTTGRDGIPSGWTVQDVVIPTPNHDYVEIAGIKWATMNVGANSVTDAGLYFQWGDTSGYTAAQIGSDEGQKYFGNNNNDYIHYKDNDYTKYNGNDSLTTLQSSDDAAKKYWGNEWKIPTKSEFQTLIAAVNTTWTNSYQDSGVAGVVCTDKTDSSKTLFFPAVGFAADGGVRGSGDYNYYWSSSLYSNSAANFLYGNSSSINCYSSISRSFGLSVRAILDE